jgi:hypothetical protein
MDLLVIVMAAALGTAIGGALAFVALRKGRSSGADAELHILRERLRSSEASAESATAALAHAQRTADERARLLDKQTEQVNTAEERVTTLLAELEKQVEKRQASERRVDELVLEHGDSPMLPLERDTELIRLSEQLDAERRKSESLEAEIARRDEERGEFVVGSADHCEVEKLRSEVENEREHVRTLLGELGTLLSQTAEAGAGSAPAEVSDHSARQSELAAEVAELTAAVAEQKRLREEASEQEVARVSRLTDEITRLAAELEEERARVAAMASVQDPQTSENGEAARFEAQAAAHSAEVARLTSAQEAQTAAHSAELAGMKEESAAEVARLTAAQEAQSAAHSAELAGMKEESAAEVARLTAAQDEQAAAHSAELARLREEFAAEIARLTAAHEAQATAQGAELARLSSELEQAREREADVIQRSSAEIARLSSVVVEQKRLWEEDSRAEQSAGQILRAQVESLTAEVGRLTAEAAEQSKLRQDADAAQAHAAETSATLRDEVARLAALVLDERKLREEALAQAEADRAVVAQVQAARTESEAAWSAERERIAQLEAERAAHWNAEIAAVLRQRDEATTQLSMIEMQLNSERTRIAALEAEQLELTRKLDDEQRSAAKGRELLALAQDRMASLFAVFSGEAAKPNGHAAENGAKPKPEAVSAA